MHILNIKYMRSPTQVKGTCLHAHVFEGAELETMSSPEIENSVNFLKQFTSQLEHSRKVLPKQRMEVCYQQL